MDNTVSVGMNRTGLDMAPLSKGPMVEFAQQESPTLAPGDAQALDAMRKTYALEADRVGTVPPPARLKGMATTMLDTLKGNKPQVLIDKLGERLAYERTGVRLYQALITKVSAASSGPVVDVAALERIRADEEAHFHMVAKFLQQIGADPTAMTPCADVIAVASMGHLQVLTDPRTTVSQALNSILAIELTDNASWELLIELVNETGHKEMIQAFTVALETEQQHLQMVRGWLRQAVLEEAT
jgi:rubrerythrin